jgi:ribosomal-protein-alanine N-acetyltransferase
VIENNPETKYWIRAASKEDLPEVAAFWSVATYRHHHLDWVQPTHWIDYQPFLLEGESSNIHALLSTPVHSSGQTWLRAFAASHPAWVKKGWGNLLPPCLEQLRNNRTSEIYAVPLYDWFQALLRKSGFIENLRIVNLEWSGDLAPDPPIIPGLTFTSLERPSINQVLALDHLSFPPIWQLVYEDFNLALNAGGWGAMAVVADELVGYILCMEYPQVIHLARLAVNPDWQGKNVGKHLIKAMHNHYSSLGFYQFTVNTQSNNSSSLKLYRRMGFQTSGVDYPVYCLPLE